MSITFLHTADWQLGKPFAGIDDERKRALLQNERFIVLKRIAEQAKIHGAEFVVVAGDLFDSPRATKETVTAACSAIGSIGVPVYAIPGNHDHGGAGSLWEQGFFQRARDELAPDFHVLLASEPVELANAVLLPCPLLRRHEANDTTAWVRSWADADPQFGDKPRIVIAHGSVLNFGAFVDDEEADSAPPNFIDVARLPAPELDYIALGDWHGTKEVTANTWYSGTPELDRFVKGEAHNPGNILVVKATRGQPPKVQCVRTGSIGWHELAFDFADDSGIDHLRSQVDAMLGTRANEDLLRLHLGGVLGIEAATLLEQMVEAWNARLLRVKLDQQIVIVPSAGELEGLTQRTGDPLISLVATQLAALAADGGDQAAVARIALRELHAACTTQ